MYGAESVCDFSLGNPDRPAAARNSPRSSRESRPMSEPGVHAYMPNGGYPWVREAIAGTHVRRAGGHWTQADMLMTCGAAGALNVVFKALLNPGDEVILLAPYFVEYNFYVDNHGGSEPGGQHRSGIQP